MLNDNEILYIVPFTNVKVEKTALNKDFGGWSILTGEQLLNLYGEFKNLSSQGNVNFYYLVKKFHSENEKALLEREENLLIAILRSLNYEELEIGFTVNKTDSLDYSEKYNPYKKDAYACSKYFYPGSEKNKVFTTSLLNKIIPILSSSTTIPDSIYELLATWNESFKFASPWRKAKLLFPIWDKLVFSIVKKEKYYDEADLLKQLVGTYPDKCNEMAVFLDKMYNNHEQLPWSDYVHLARKMKFSKRGSGTSSELFALLLGKHIIPTTQRIIWHSLLNLATMGCVYQYIKTEYDDPKRVDWSCW